MRGITEERLSIALDNTDDPMGRAAIESLIDKCTELNPWQTIESAPLDRKIRAFKRAGYQVDVTLYEEVARRYYTHWQELPEDPK